MSTTHDLVLANLGLVPAVAKPFLWPGISADHKDELLAAGRLGLVEAAASYDASKGTFSHWAWAHIRGRVIDAVRFESYPMLSQVQFRARPKVLRYLSEHPDASLEEAAAYAKTTATQAAAVAAHRPLASLDAQAPGEEFALGDRLAADGPQVEDAVVDGLRAREIGAALRRAVAELPELQREAVERYFGLDGDPVDWASMAEESGLSRETTRTRGVRGLRNLANDAELLAAVS